MSPDIAPDDAPISLARRAARLLLPALGILLVVLYLGRLGGFPLQDPDEGRYAEIPREMIELRDLVTPRLNYVEYFEKPPLLYWLVALAFHMFGTSEGVARLVPALAGLATIGVTYLHGRRLFGRRPALVAAATLATAPLFFVFSQALVIDMLVTFLLTACFAGLGCGIRDPANRGWPLVVASASALAVLAKGLIGLVLPGIVLVVLLALERDWRLLRSLLRPAPIVAFLLIATPWFVAMAARHPEFLHEFFVVEHLQRFATDKVGHPEGPLYYAPVLVFGLLPWTLVAGKLASTRAGRQAWRALGGPERRFLVVWLVTVVVFFSIARSKLAGYVLPAMPPALLLFAGWIDRVEGSDRAAAARSVRPAAGLLVALGIALMSAGAAFPLLIDILHRDVEVLVGPTLQSFRLFLALGGALAIVGGAMCGRRSFIGARGPSGAIVAIAAVLALVLLPLVAGRSTVKTSRHLANAIVKEARPGDLVVQYRILMQGLPFYLRERIVQIDEYGEIRRGAERTPDRAEYFWDGTERLEREWGSARRVFLITKRGQLADLSTRLWPTPSIVADDGRRVLLTNRRHVRPHSIERGEHTTDGRLLKSETSNEGEPRPG